MYACMYVCMYACMHVCMFACMHVQICRYAGMHVCMHEYIYAYANMHVCMYACMNTYMHMHICMYACMHVCMYACIYACMHVCMYTCMYVCMHVCMHACMYVCMHVCMFACIHIWSTCQCTGFTRAFQFYRGPRPILWKCPFGTLYKIKILTDTYIISPIKSQPASNPSMSSNAKTLQNCSAQVKLVQGISSKLASIKLGPSKMAWS